MAKELNKDKTTLFLSVWAGGLKMAFGLRQILARANLMKVKATSSIMLLLRFKS